MEYANQLISGSPFMVKAYDVGSISVEKITDGVVGRRSSFFGKFTELSSLKRHGPFVAFYFYCKIMLYGINYTYHSINTVNIFHVLFRG